MEQLERIPAEEAEQIEKIVHSTMEQMRNRYPGEQQVLRNVHPKDHGCVSATFQVEENLPEEHRVGIFRTPGREYEAWIRFSNFGPRLKTDDSPLREPGKSNSPRVHGSRGMALKLLGVSGQPLLPPHGPLTQDFLMVNHPVFAFANVEDYEALSAVLAGHDDDPTLFFRRLKFESDGKTLDMKDPASRRAWITRGTIGRIQSPGDNPPPYQLSPRSPVDNRYFSGSPFLFGQDRVMKFSAIPESPVAGDPADLADPAYLRKALLERLTAPGAKSIHSQFQVQLRSAAEISTNLEDMFTPWHGLVDHRPLGGINRLRRAVYEASAAMRHIPKEPAPAKL